VKHDKAANSTIFFKFLKHLKKHITLLTYLLLCLVASVRLSVISSRRWGIVGHWARHSTECSCVWAKGGYFELWQYANRV